MSWIWIWILDLDLDPASPVQVPRLLAGGRAEGQRERAIAQGAGWL